jgi:hypothetical protein
MPVSDQQLYKIRKDFMDYVFADPVTSKYVKGVFSDNRPDESVLVVTLLKEIPKEVPKEAFPSLYQGVLVQYVMDG